MRSTQTRSWLLFGILGLSGCSSSGGADVLVGDASVTEAGDVLSESSACANCVDLQWREESPGFTALDHHVTFGYESAQGAWLYVACGAFYDGSTQVFGGMGRAALQDEGRVNNWVSLGTLAFARAAPSVASVGSVVVLTGGKTGRSMNSIATTETVLLTLAENGTIDRRVVGPPLPIGRFHHGSTAVDRWVFLVGGYGTNNELFEEVLRAQLSATGELSAWETAGRIPVPLTLAGVASHAGRIYVVGGLDGTQSRSAVLSAPVAMNGSLGAWREEIALPHPRETPAVFVHNGALYVVGGTHGQHGTLQTVLDTTVLRAALGADGSLGTWQALPTPLPAGRHHLHHAVALRGRVYLYGGRDNTETSTATVWSAALP